MKSVVLFGGTTEGRELAAFLARMKLQADVYVVSKYGASLMHGSKDIRIHVGRLGENDMKKMLDEKRPAFVLDATHPYAVHVTKSLCHAASEAGIPYIRVRREDAGKYTNAATSIVNCAVEADANDRSESESRTEDYSVVPDVASAVKFLEKTEGNIFLTTGSKELPAFSEMEHFHERCYVRALPSEEALKILMETNVDGRHRILMQGPFSEELNYAMLKETDAKWMVTKDSGERGGFSEKCEAALRAGARILVIGCPHEELSKGAKVMNLAEARVKIEAYATMKETGMTRDPRKQPTEIDIIGMGPGSAEWVSPEAKMAVFRANALAGARRMMELARQVLPGDPEEQMGEMSQKMTLVTYKKEDMREFVDRHPEIGHFAFLFSGDTRVYSGAQGLAELFPKEENFIVRSINGMSSVTYFAQKMHLSTLGYPLNAVIVSLHGRDADLVDYVRANRDVFVLLGGRESLHKAATELFALEHLLMMEDSIDGDESGKFRLALGERLTYEDEKITEGKPRDFMHYNTNSLAMLYIHNDYAK